MSAFTVRTTPIQTPVAFGSDGQFQIVTPLRNETSTSTCSINSEPDLCRSTDVGHRVHFIQLKMAIGHPVEPFTLIRTTGNSLTISVNDSERTLYTHDTSLIQELLNRYLQPVPGWLHQYNLIEIQGRVFSVVESIEELTPCHTPKNAK